MQTSIILIGGGGHCKACIDVIEQEGKYQIAGITDLAHRVGESILGYPIIGTDDDLPKLLYKHKNALITLGQIRSATLRRKAYDQLKGLGANLPVIISPHALVSQHAQISEGTIVMHHALINAHAQIGHNNIINSKALIEHEAIIGDHCHISTAAKINGQVSIGNECFVGSGATIANNIQLTNQVVIPAGTTVFKNINKSGIYVKR